MIPSLMAWTTGLSLRNRRVQVRVTLGKFEDPVKHQWKYLESRRET